uniref:DUF1768 domain-containing protein n=1 Tax=Strongyloides papillosus TaxID=174720 RepID=A0A0N5BYR7_STREA
MIINATKPYEIKRLGRNVRNFDQHIWDNEKVRILHTGLILKFNVPRMNDLLREFYLDRPKNRRFVEVSSSKFWGCVDGVMEDDPKNEAAYGRNMTGRMLTELVRSG